VYGYTVLHDTPACVDKEDAAVTNVNPSTLSGELRPRAIPLTAARNIIV
jgi:hypothetical protein